MWLPGGGTCYAISGELTWSSFQWVRIIGADPSTTKICWTGSGGGNMILMQGTAYSELGRLTFDGKTTASVILDQAYVSGNFFDTGNLYNDDIFQNAAYGISCGFTAGAPGTQGAGCAETTFLRSSLLNMTTAGVAMGNFNALDFWAWYATITGNATGLTNLAASGAGGFHAFESNFGSNTTADLSNNNTDQFSARWNYSTGSAKFWTGVGSANPCPLNLQGNVILDPTSTAAISPGCLGPVIAIDNTIRSLANATGPVMTATGAGSASLFSFGNTFSANQPIGAANGAFASIFDVSVPRSQLTSLVASTLPGTPPNMTLSRTITELTAAGYNNTTTQNDINSACSGEVGDDRPVIHFQAGTYTGVSLSVPASCDIQLIGDGGNSILTGTGSGPTLTLNGPSFATLRDIHVKGNGNVAITGSGLDQIGGRIFTEGLTVYGNQITQNILFNGLANASLEMHSLLQENSSGTVTPIGINVVGPSGAWNGATVEVFAGVSFYQVTQYQVSGSGHLIARDVWFDNGGTRGSSHPAAA